MKRTGPPYAQLAEAAGKVRMRSLVTETRYAQAKADGIELSGFLERVAWMQARSLVMQARNPKAIEMIRALSLVERAIADAITEARTS